MKNDEWIYRKAFPDYEELFERIEEALGFKLFIWQKSFIVMGHFRQYGATTARILRELLDVTASPIDFTARPMSNREDFYRKEMKEIQGKLKNVGIETRMIFWSAADRREYAQAHHEGFREQQRRRQPIPYPMQNDIF